eukprot:IDg11552t1
MRMALKLNWMESVVVVVSPGYERECPAPVPSFAFFFTESCLARVHLPGSKRDECPFWLLSLFNWNYESTTQTLGNAFRKVHLKINENGAWSLGPICSTSEDNQVRSESETIMDIELGPETLVS